MLLSGLRPGLAKVIAPIARGLVRIGVTADMVTIVGTVGVAAAALFFYPRGELFWGSIVVTLFVVFDMLDGAVARARGGSSTWGAFLDSTLDRVADAAVFGSFVLWYMFGGHSRLLAGVALFDLVCGALVSYAKARAESLGYRADTGFAERTERLLIVLVAAGLQGLGVPYVLAIGLWALAPLTAFTFGQRVVAARRSIVAGTAAGTAGSGARRSNADAQ